MYLGVDGDNIGALLEKRLLEDDEGGVRILSKEVDTAIIEMAQAFREVGMEIIFSSGDSLLCKGEVLDLDKLIKTIKLKSFKFRFSAGVSDTLRNTYLALKYAKVSGKNRIVLYEKQAYKVIELN
jgi:hypothetical protein